MGVSLSHHGVSAVPAALPAPIRHVLVVSFTLHRFFWCCGIVGDVYASASVVHQLVSFFRLLRIPLVVHAGDGSRAMVDGLSGVCDSTAKDKGEHGYKQVHWFPQSRDDDTWFVEACKRFGTSLWWGGYYTRRIAPCRREP